MNYCYMAYYTNAIKMGGSHNHHVQWMKPDTKLHIVSYYLYRIKIKENQSMLIEVRIVVTLQEVGVMGMGGARKEVFRVLMRVCFSVLIWVDMQVCFTMRKLMELSI